MDAGGGAFPISPPSAKEVGRIPEPSSPDRDAFALLADDVPSRLRDQLASPVLGKHLSSDDPPSDASKWMRLASGERSDVILETSDAFDGQMDDAWDLDDAQLYSGESLLLANASPSPSPTPTRHARRTPAVALQQLLEVLFSEEEEEEAAAHIHVRRVDGELVVYGRALVQLHSVLRRCARDTDASLAQEAPRSDVPRHLLDLNTGHLERLLHLLERTMRHALRGFASDDTLASRVDASIAGLLCAQCVLTIFAYEQLPKYLFSEELVELCITTIKAPLEQLVLPLVEARASGTGPWATEAASLDSDTPPDALRELNTHFHLTCSTLVLLERMLGAASVAVSDTLVIACVYLSLAPFFVQDKETGNTTRASVYAHAHVLRPVRLSGLNILRNIFTHYAQQRTWVLSELLVSLLRLPDLRARVREFRLANGKKIYSLTALLLQLVQAASIETPSARERVQAWVDEGGEGVPDTNQAAVHALASTVTVYLTQKAAQAKVVKHSQDLSYASVVYCLMEDLLTLLFLPDWPAAPLLLACFCRTFVAFVHDPKSSVDAKALALDHLGVVGARIEQAQAEMRAHRRHTPPLPSLAQLCAATDVAGLHERERTVQGVVQRLAKHTEPGIPAAVAFHLAQLGYEVVLALDAIRMHEAPTTLSPALAGIFARLRLAHDAAHVDAHAVPQLVLSSAYFVTTPMLLAPLLHGTSAQALATRTRALRGIGNIAAMRPALLDDEAVRAVVLAHVTDTSASVRETAIAILGAYLMHDADARMRHRSVLMERAMDAAVGVRKRVVRLLRDLYAEDDTYTDKLNAVVRILRYVHDEDPGLQTLAVQTLAALWLPGCLDVGDETLVEESVPTVAQMLADIGAQVREQPSPLEAFLRRIPSSPTLNVRLGALVDHLLRDLFAEAVSAQTLLDRMRIVQVLVASFPGVLTVSRAKQLLAYVHGATSPDEVAVMEEILKIYCLSLPHMPRTARAFAHALEQSLTPLVSRCTLHPSASALPALVACFCTVIEHQTHHDALLQRTFSACYQRLEALAASDAPLDQAGCLAMTIAALVCRFSRRSDTEVDATFHALERLLSRPTQRLAALPALGALLCARPAYFLAPRVSTTLDTLLAHGPMRERHLVLRLLLEYLQVEAAATAAPQDAPQPTDMLGELQGTTEEHADTGVASVLIQRYAPYMLQATLDVQHPAVQRTANEILKVSVLQGLSHPIQCMPYLVALETTHDPTLRRRAGQLHRHLATKHASLLAARYSEPMRASFAFQAAQSAPERPRGFRVEDEPRALLQTWYSMLREQRTTRHAFLRALVRLLDVPAPHTCSDEAVALAAYAAENLATLEYKLLDEPLYVLYELHLLEAETGMQVWSMAQRFLRQREPSPLTDEEEEEENTNDTALARAALIMQMAQTLRTHLLRVYRLSEAKCAKYAQDPRAERNVLAHRALADPMQLVVPLEVPRIRSTGHAVSLLEEWVEAADDAALDMD